MIWKLDDHRADASVAGWNLHADLSNPGSGWSISRNDPESAGGLLAAQSSVPISPLEEAYVRENELVARYPQSSEPGIGLEFRYRVVSASDDRIVLQFTCAIQTRQFESYPTLGLSTPTLLTKKMGTINAWNHEKYPGVLVMEPADVAQSRLTPGTETDSVQLFGDFLERGVIRKCRMRLIVGTSACSDLQGEHELNALAQEPLPLLA